MFSSLTEVYVLLNQHPMSKPLTLSLDFVVSYCRKRLMGSRGGAKRGMRTSTGMPVTVTSGRCQRCVIWSMWLQWHRCKVMGVWPSSGGRYVVIVWKKEIRERVSSIIILYGVPNKTSWPRDFVRDVRAHISRSSPAARSERDRERGERENTAMMWTLLHTKPQTRDTSRRYYANNYHTGNVSNKQINTLYPTTLRMVPPYPTSSY
jgi:hypothetical protein